MPPELQLHVVGISHHTAGVKVREHLVLTPAEVAAWLEQQRAAGRSAALLSTCNRFEIYWTGDADLEPWFVAFAESRGVEAAAVRTRFDGAAAVRHLFRVASGLDSQILGESEILGQVRRAHQAAQAAGTNGRELDAAFCGAIAAGRRVRRETPLGRHPASVGSAAVEVALERSAVATAAAESRTDLLTAVILGAGEVAEGVVATLLERGVEAVTLVNRRPDRAAVLAARRGVASRQWDERGAALRDAHLLFVTTGAKHAVVTADDLRQATAGRSAPLVVLDLALPRNVDPAARDLAGVSLLNLDDLQELRCPAAGQPSIAVAEAERMIAEELSRLGATLRLRAAAPQFAELHRLGSELAREEVERALATLDRLEPAEREVVRMMAERLVRRLLYPVSRSLREEEVGEDEKTDGKRSA